ncbi:hypothetical protein [Neobacillus sp. Marseille-QA0830]
MKKVLFTLLSVFLVALAGCSSSGNTGEKKAEAKSASSTKESAETEEQIGEDTPPEISITGKVIQLGNESLSKTTEGYPDTVIGDKDGYTYIVEPVYTFVGHYENYGTIRTKRPYFGVLLSVVKDNKWLMKEKQIDLSTDIWPEYPLNPDGVPYIYGMDLAFKNNGSEVFVISRWYTEENSNNAKQQWNKITFTPEGKAIAEKVNELKSTVKTYGDTDDLPSFLSGTDGYYLKQKDQDMIHIYNTDGKKIFTIDKGKFPDLLFINEHEGLAYDGESVYDINAKDLLWNDDGSKVNVETKSADTRLTTNGYTYSLTTLNGVSTLVLEQINKDSVNVLSSMSMPSDLPIAKASLSMDSKNIYVYTLVDFKGAATIQRYTIPQVNQQKN